MNGKEFMQSFHYFDKRTNEEDMPVIVSNKIQDQLEQLELVFEEFFDDSSLSQAKVSNKKVHFEYYSMFFCLTYLF
jgi:hypothetical protein